MNTELLQMAKLTLIARNFLESGQIADCLDYKHINRLIFHMRNKYFGLLPYGRSVDGLEKWLAYLTQKQCTSIFLILPDEIDEHAELSLYTTLLNSNAGWVIITNTVIDYSAWQRRWKQANDGKWDVHYYEKTSPGRNPLDFHFHYDPQELPAALKAIKQFASEIGCAAWIKWFDSALAILAGEPEVEPRYRVELKGLIPQDKMPLINALSHAWIFGGTGWWNDDGAAAAASADRRSDYQHYSWQLYQAIMRVVMYCVNGDQNLDQQ